MRLVFEAFPTPAQLAAGTLTVTDITPQSFFQGAAFLYTDEVNGAGILQENNIPPLAHDIAYFKNCAFYANTSIKHFLQISLLGISNILLDNNSPSLSITSANGTNTYEFVHGANEVSQINLPSASVFSPTTSNYFLLNGGNDLRQYYIWFNILNGTDTDPGLADKIGIEVVLNSTDTNLEVAQKVTNALNITVDDFEASVSSNSVIVSNIIEGPATDISPLTATDTMSGVTGYSASVLVQGIGNDVTKQTTQINTIAGSLFTPSGNADYFTMSSAFDRQIYYFWYNVNDNNTDPSASNPGRTGVQIAILSTDTDTEVATKTTNVINTLTNIFTATSNNNIVDVSNFFPGPSLDAQSFVVNGGFTISTILKGALNVLLSNSLSPSLAVQETAQSLISAINENNAEIVYGFYISGVSDVPGKILLEERTIQDIPFYVVASDSIVGSSFNPVLSPSFTINNITAANPTTVTTTQNNGLQDQQQVFITNSDSFPNIDGIQTVINVTPTTFQLDLNVVNSGSNGSITPLNVVQISSNDPRPNRIFYSKYLQPEAVPSVNFLDVGARDKAILRIIPLRDSLFILKEDGVYRISGETAPFNLALFDSSFILIATDSAAIANNVIYGWGTQGIMSLTESGTQIISRPIDVDILPLGSPQYANFDTATWGIGYNSDYSYLVWTVSQQTDTLATQAFIFNSLTNTWTRWDKSNTCGVINPSTDNKLYLGAGDTNFIEQERKNFDRTDYADRETVIDIALGNYKLNQSQLKLFQLSNVTDFSNGDVITQEQTISIYDFNKLLQKLDNDPGVGPFYGISSSVSDVSFDPTTGLVTLITLSPFDTFLDVGDFISISGVNPVGYNGISQITNILNSTTLQYKLSLNPGTYLGSGGQVQFRWFETFQPQPGDSLRTSIVDLTNKLSINTNLSGGIEYTEDVGDYLYQNVSVSAVNPAIFTMPSYNFGSVSVNTVTDTIIFPGNFLVNGNKTSFTTTGTLPGGLSASNSYYIVGSTSSSFQVSLTPGGSVVDITSQGTGIQTIHQSHQLKTGRYIQVSNSDTSPNINGDYLVTRINNYQFSIPIAVSTQGTADIETLINSFQDIRGTYNIIIQDLNLDDGVVFANYSEVNTTTLLETVILNVNYPLKQLQIALALQFIVGPITVYKAINSEFEYTPIDMGDALSLKHFREATIMYIDKTFTNAVLEFASDLLPSFIPVPIPGLGAGLQGNDPNGENYYGGTANSPPFRTYIPLEKARCRFLRIVHNHTVAREKYSVLGTSLTARTISTRGYR